MSITSFFYNTYGPSETVRFRQIVANFIDIFNMLLDKVNPHAMLALWAGIIVSKTAEVILLQSLKVPRNDSQEPSRFLRVKAVFGCFLSPRLPFLSMIVQGGHENIAWHG